MESSLYTKAGRLKRMKNWLKVNMPKFAYALFALALFSLVIHIVCFISPSFADFFNIRIAGGVRFVLAKITGIVPFSLAEFFIILTPFLIAGVIAVIVHFYRKEDDRKINRFLCGAFALLSVFYTLFVFTLGTGYRGRALDEKLGLERKEISSDELADVAKWLIKEINKRTEQIRFIDGSASVMPCDFSEMNDRLCAEYAKASEKYDFIMGFSSRLKPVMSGKLMSKAGLLGMYSYYTGEANVSLDYPDYVNVFTCAHELSHQRGIAKEDDASFMAFLLCASSDDPYIAYCGYLNIYEYLRTPLSKKLTGEGRKSEFEKIERTLAAGALRDLKVSYEKNRDNQGSVREISEAVHDAALRPNDPRGTASYGYVVDLVAAWYFKEIIPLDPSVG